jgi:hypothetical protein
MMLSPPSMRTFTVPDEGPFGLGSKVIDDTSGFRQ